MGSAAMGLRAHSGWATLVVLTGPTPSPGVVLRQRLEISDRGIPGSEQPYHAAQGLGGKEAEELVLRCAEKAKLIATQGLRAVIVHLRENGHDVVRSGILLASGRSSKTIAEGLASHASMHAAEGNLFRNALIGASEICSVPVVGVKERELHNRASLELGVPTELLRRNIHELGRPLGPPWRQDEKLAALVAWLALAASPHPRSPT